MQPERALGSFPFAGGAKYLNGTTSQQVKGSEGDLIGIFVDAASATPTLKLWDNTAGSGTVLVTAFTPTAGTWYWLPFHFGTGLFITVSGTVGYTISYT